MRLAFLNRVCAAQIDIHTGRLVYTQMLNHQGGIESDLTVARLAETEFMLTLPLPLCSVIWIGCAVM